MEKKWAVEDFKSVVTRYEATEVLFEEKADFQHVQVVNTVQYGRMLLIDGIVQTTQADEFIYHEMMTHPPMLIHPAPKKVLVIGGGDGGILREALSHPEVEEITLVEIESTVIDLSKKYLPSISDGAFNDPKVRVVIDDGAKFVENPPEKYDVAVVDSPDPIGPAAILFSKGFYKNLHNALKDDGIMVRQSGSTFMQPEEQAQAFGIVKDIFRYCTLYVFNVPTYIGGLFSCVLGSKSIDPSKVDADRLSEGYKSLTRPTRYYNPDVHAGAFALPQYVRGNLNHENK